MALLPSWLARGGVVVLVFASILAIRLLDRSPWDRIRERLLLGLPWGTLVSAGFVFAVYLLLQGGLDHWHDPVVVPFRSWSYFYPLGILVSGFAHQGASHLLGNLFSTLVLGSLAEYAWGHFPRERGATTFASPLANPFVRAFVVFPAAVVLVGLLTGVFALGPVVGFSGVVFAFVGFALVRYPLGTVVALTAESAVSLVYRSFQNPVLTGEASSRFITPWWAGVSIQGHLFGLLLGATVGALLAARRDGSRSPSGTRLWLGAVLVGTAMNLWAVWWYRGNNEYVLYRVVGLWLVVVLAALIATAIAASDREFPRWITARRTAAGVVLALFAGRLGWWRVDGSLPDPIATFGTPIGTLPTLDAALAAVTLVLLVAIVLGDEPLFEGASRRDVARLLLVLPLVFSGAVAVPVGLATVDDPAPPGEVAFEVRDYTVTYAENVTSEMVSVIDVSAFGETTEVRTSGVIVISERRHLWTTMASTSRLAFTGRYEVVLGGVGWRETVSAARRGWSMQGGPSAYVVYLKPPDGDWRLAYRSTRALARPVLAGNRVGIRPGNESFLIELVRNGSAVASAPIPRKNETVTLDGIDFVRDGKHVVAVYDDGTRIRVASRETYK